MRLLRVSEPLSHRISSIQYGAAKAALIFDTERWAMEFVPYGIRVNTVSPGSILAEGNGWDRYRLANPGYFEDYGTPA